MNTTTNATKDPKDLSKLFHIGDILSITTGRLVSPRHMEGVYDILGYMTGDSLFTHQLIRAADRCKPVLLEQHPFLAGWGEQLVAALDSSSVQFRDADLLPFVLEAGCSDLEVVPLSDWESRNPIEELCEMVGSERVVIVQL